MRIAQSRPLAFLLSVLLLASTQAQPKLRMVGWGDTEYNQYKVLPKVEDIIAVSAGLGFSVALRGDGTVTAWGHNEEGQTNVPAGLSGVAAVAAGDMHVLVLKRNGTLAVWGKTQDYNGPVAATIPAGLTGVKSIAAGGRYSAAVKADGTVTTWGTVIVPTPPAGLSGVVSVAAGSRHMLALKTDGTVVAWGANDAGQATVPAGLANVVAVRAGADHSCALKADGTVVVWGRNDSGQRNVPAGLSQVIEIASGGHFCLARTANGQIVGWGRGNEGQLNIPSGLSNSTALVSGQSSSHVLALTAEGEVVAWGENRYGQCRVPPGPENLIAIAAGELHTLGLKEDGTVTVWGSNVHGRSTPPAGLKDVVAVAAGRYHSAVLKSDGTVVAWGADSTVPSGLSDVVAIATGFHHTLALKNNGTVVAWGSNGDGQTNVPAGLSDVVAVAAGGTHSIALKNDGTVVAWGANDVGQTNVPAGLTDVIKIAAGHRNGVALKSDGTIRQWGATNPPPADLNDVTAISAGGAVVASLGPQPSRYTHSLGLKADGTIVGWGSSQHGQITIPTGLPKSVAIAAGGLHSVALVEVPVLELEVASADAGLVEGGFQDAAALGSLAVEDHTVCKLVDLVDNVPGEEAECLYVNSLILPANAELDLNGLKLYARTVQISGEVSNGAIQQIADTQSLAFNQSAAGALSQAGELDAWQFAGKSGTQVTVVVETGGAEVQAPALERARVEIQDAQGGVIASAASTITGQAVLLSRISLPADGDYRVLVRAAHTRPAGTGSYRVAVWDSTPEVQTLVLNQQHQGRIERPYSVDAWNFTASAGQQVRFDLINSTAADVAFSLRGPLNWSGFDQLKGNSELVTLPHSGVYTLVAEGLGGAPGLDYAFRLTETQQTTLVLNEPFAGQLVGGGQAQLFRLEVTQAGPLEVVLRNSGAGNRTALYASRGSSPSRASYEYGISSGAGADCRLVIPSASTGVWYVLVYADQVPSPGGYTLEARMPGVLLSRLSLNRQVSNVPADLTISGAGFLPGTIVELLAGDGQVMATAAVAIDSYSQISVNFAANAAPPGTYDVRVRVPGGAQALLPGAFTYLPGGTPRLETRLILPGVLRRQGMSTIFVEYANTGTASMPAPLLVLKSGDPDGSDRPILTLDQSRIVQNFWSGTAGMPPGTAHEVMILACGAQPGVLNPGERLQVPVYYLGLLEPWNLSDDSVEMEIRHWRAEETETINWAERKEALRPPTLPAAVWDVVYANLTADLATTSAYVRMLNDNARYLSRLGQHVTDVSDLWDFEVQQAYGYSALPVLDAATDAAVTAPGLALALERRFSSNLRSRNSAGLFGQGWFSQWETRLTVERGGDVVKIIGEGGSARVYIKDTRDASYFSGAGDSSSLALVAGVYEIRQPNGTVMRFRPDGRIHYVQDANGNRITTSWNDHQLTGLIHTSGASITLAYGTHGLVSQVAESTGRTMTFAYQGSYLTSATTDDGKVTAYAYETGGAAAVRHALTSVTRAGVTRHFTWDARGRLESSWLANGEEMTLFEYDSAGGVGVTQGNGTTTLFFEHHGLLARVVDPLGHATTSEYDDDLRRKRLILPTGESKSFTWCNCGSPTSITDEMGHVTRFRYDHPLKRMTQFTDAKGNLTRYSYDTKGNLLGTTYADNTVETLASYTAQGLPQAQTNRRGQSTGYSWTTAGQVARQSFGDGSYNDFAFDDRGNLVTVTEHPVSGPDKVTAYTYAHATDGDRLKKVTYPTGKWVEYFHDAAGRRARMTDSAGGDTRYEYDTAGRLWKLRDAAEVVIVEYLYDAAGRLSRINKGNGTYTTHEFDAAGQILRLINHAPNGTPNSRFDYTYDARGRRTSMDTLDGKWTYSYDGTGQLTQAVFASTNAEIANQDLRYHYDPLGNRTSTVLNGITTLYAPNHLNQYSNVGGVTQQYDADGNLIFDGERTMVYDVQNRLVRVTGAHGVTDYEYDALGNRTAAVTNGERTEYLLDPTGMVNVLAHGSTTDNSVRYQYGEGLVGRIRGQVGNSEFFDSDGIGSVAGITTTQGSQESWYAYAPFGEVLKSQFHASNLFQHIGVLGVVSEPSGLTCMRARYFTVEKARFSSPDPSHLGGGDANLYRYADNSPTNLVDPVGLFSLDSIKIYDQKLWDAANSGDTDGILAGYERAKRRIGIGACAVGIASEVYQTYPPKFIKKVPYDAAVMGKYVYDSEKKLRGNSPPYCTNLPPNDNQPNGHGHGTVGDAGSNANSQVVRSFDPNEKLGPGLGAAGWVKASALLPYRINFENLGPGSKDANGDPYPTHATAPAQRVTITDPLAADFDWETFQITELGWGDTVVQVPAGTSHYMGTVNMTYNEVTFAVEIEAKLDITTGVISVRFQSLDLETSLPPDGSIGFLPPEDGTGIGMGHFSYTIRSKTELPHDRQIRNVAVIKFDENEVIATNQVDPQDSSKGTDPAKEALVTIDNSPPTSSVQVLPGQSRRSFLVSWSGTDEGSGVGQYHLFVGANGGSFEPWLNTSATSAVFDGTHGVDYTFYSLAEDKVGNLEVKEAAPESGTEALRFPPLALLVGMPLSFVVDGNLDVRSVAGLPAGLTYNAKTRTISGRPTRAGTYLVTVTLRDGNVTAKDQFKIEVAPLPDHVPGKFVAMIGPNETLNAGLGGSLTMDVTTAASVTGSFILGGKRHAFRGQIKSLSASDITFETVISRGKVPPELNLHLVFGADHLLTGEVNDGANKADLAGWRRVWRAKGGGPAVEVPLAQRGRINMLIDHSGAPWRGDAAVPQGLGFASLTVNKMGAIQSTGRNLDGVTMTMSSILGPDGQVGLWVPLYVNTGSVTLRADLNEQGGLSGTGKAVRKPQGVREKLYREGFGHAETDSLPAGPVPLVLAGGRWVAPKNAPVLQLPYDPQNPAPNAWLEITDGGIKTDTVTLTPVVPLTITQRNQVLPGTVNPAAARLTISPATGTISGTLRLRDTNEAGRQVIRPVTFYGLCVPSLAGEAIGGGVFTLPQLPDSSRVLSGRILLKNGPPE